MICLVGCEKNEQPSMEANTQKNTESQHDKPSSMEIAEEEWSELTILMRSMYDDAELVKNAIAEQKMPEDFREKFIKIHTATPTEEDMEKVKFSSFADSFLASLDAVYEHPTPEKFNTMVRQCVTCHESFCPGVIPKIKKLTMQEKI
jgi:hypothetical protein